jgi:hypothetical protein
MLNHKLVGYQYREHDDIYGNGPDQQRAKFAMMDAIYEAGRKPDCLPAPDWFRPMLIDEYHSPRTKNIFDYGNIPDLISDRENARNPVKGKDES